MEIQNNNQTNQNPKRKYWKFVVWFLAIIVLAAGGFFVWDKYFSPEAKLNRQNAENYQKYLDWQANYEKAMKEDTYGGKTPEETLKMFIEALRKGDIELASKYFALNTNEKSEYYLTRGEWEEGLRKAKEEGKLGEIIEKIEKTSPFGYSDSYNWYKKAFSFESLNQEGVVEILIELGLNPYSGIWKIISL
jgi:predicted negative regulator of RcsB-dependent stress response